MDTIPEASPASEPKPQPPVLVELEAMKAVLWALFPLTTESRQRILRHASDYYQTFDPRRGNF